MWGNTAMPRGPSLFGDTDDADYYSSEPSLFADSDASPNLLPRMPSTRFWQKSISISTRDRLSDARSLEEQLMAEAVNLSPARGARQGDGVSALTLSCWRWCWRCRSC